MPNRTRALMVFVIVAQALAAACGDQRFAPPTGPGGVAPPGPNTGPPVFGQVSDTAFRPLAGARVEVMDGPQAGSSATADATGGFQLTGTFDETTRFRASKDGHAAAMRTFSVYGTSRYILFELEVAGPSVNLAGAYNLTVNVEGACGGFPEELRTRSYAVTLTPSVERATTAFDLAFTAAPFVENYRMALVGVAGNYVASWLGDAHGTPGLVERLAPNTFLAFEGLATATIGTDPAIISASLEGLIEYCERRSDLGSRYDCDPVQAVTRVRCTAKHTLTLTRR